MGWVWMGTHPNLFLLGVVLVVSWSGLGRVSVFGLWLGRVHGGFGFWVCPPCPITQVVAGSVGCSSCCGFDSHSTQDFFLILKQKGKYLLANLASTHYLSWGGFGLTNHEPVTLWVGYGQSKCHSGHVWVLPWPIPNPSRCHPYLCPCWWRHCRSHTCKHLTCSKIILERVLLFSNTDWWSSK